MSTSEEGSVEDEVFNEDTDSVETSSSDDDNDEHELTEDIRGAKDFLRTLSYLKNKDPQIYDKSVHFFPKDVNDEQAKKVSKKKEDPTEKPMYIRDYERDILSKEVINEDDFVEEKCPPKLTYNEEQKILKESFKSVLYNSDEDDNDDVLLKKKTKTDKEIIKEEEDYIEWLKGKKEKLEDGNVEKELKPLFDYWNNPDLDKKEAFLKDYILNKRYLEKDGEETYEDSDLSEDEKLLEEQENFELSYNSRFGNEENKEIKRYPRNIEGSLRRKNDTRKRKREEIKSRKKVEREKKKLEIKKKQKEKLNEIKERLEKLKEITGNAELGFKDDEIMEDFDPEKYDTKMNELYNDKFYEEGDDEKPDFSNYDNDDWNLDEINMDCDGEQTANLKESRSKRKKKKRKNAAYQDICDVVKPTFDPEKHSSFQKYIDHYYNLDCEDFIDDLPCRFKYKEVVPNDYGLSVEEILMADDKELNRWVSSKKITKLRPKHVEKNEVKIYKEKAKDDRLKLKLLPSLYKKDEDDNKDIYGEQEVENDTQEIEDTLEVRNDETHEVGSRLATPSPKGKKKKGETKEITNSEGMENITEENSSEGNLTNNKLRNKKKNKFKEWQRKKSNKPGAIDRISDNRLLAYNIKPRQFKSKMRYFSKQKKL